VAGVPSRRPAGAGGPTAGDGRRHGRPRAVRIHQGQPQLGRVSPPPHFQHGQEGAPIVLPTRCSGHGIPYIFPNTPIDATLPSFHVHVGRWHSTPIATAHSTRGGVGTLSLTSSYCFALSAQTLNAGFFISLFITRSHERHFALHFLFSLLSGFSEALPSSMFLSRPTGLRGFFWERNGINCALCSKVARVAQGFRCYHVLFFLY